MYIIKLDAINSTNSYLKELARNKVLEDSTVVMTRHQTAGRGQQGTEWLSEKDKNLTFSLLKNFKSCLAIDQFYLSMAVSLAVGSALNKFGIPSVVKWPNDILAGQHKIAGILIENTLKNEQLVRSVIGIGINVNQVRFDSSLRHVTSMKTCAGEDWKIDDVLTVVLTEIDHFIGLFEKGHNEELRRQYEENLFLLGVLSSFADKSGRKFKGKITGVAPDGQLQVELSNGERQNFMMKAIQFLKQ